MSSRRSLPEKANDGKNVTSTEHGAPWLAIRQLLGNENMVSHHKGVLREFGGDRTTATVFEALCFWDGLGDDPEWVYKSYEEWEEECVLSPCQVRRAVGKLMKLGLVERERRQCADGTNPYHYRIHSEECLRLVFRAVTAEEERPKKNRRGGARSRKEGNSLNERAALNERTSCRDMSLAHLPTLANLMSIDAVLTCSSDLQSWGGSDSDSCTAITPAAPPPLLMQQTLTPPADPDPDSDPLFWALIECCLLDPTDMQTGDGYSKALGQAAQSLRKRGVGPEEVRAFGRWWRTEHMRNSSPPEIKQVPQNWRRFTEWRKQYQPALRRDAMVVEVAALSTADREEWRAASQAEREQVKARLNGEGHRKHPRTVSDRPGPGRARAPTAAGVARASPALEAGERASPVPGGPSGGGPGAGAAEGGMESARVGGDR